ncbi:hypothetical protein [Streptacidiphilus sp. P02-A3a]|uniref:hypothetical protein n=1 Tax=Streptacidiphilus sp. P02-A3a TaxID=2704468 RepID=UPI001CDC2BD7|nr:hypothetical protein [Streptacidiphilus sp. P02-A3a]
MNRHLRFVPLSLQRSRRERIADLGCRLALILSVPSLFNQWMTGTDVDLGTVTAPSGMLVLGMAGWIDYWPRVGSPLSERARTAISLGGGHLHDPEDSEPSAWLCEAIVVEAAADRPLRVRAQTSASPFDGGPTIAVLEIDLGLLWSGLDDGKPVQLGDLPVDRCGMVLGDARALDGFTGLDGQSADGLADVTYWGKYEDTVHMRFGGDRIPHHRGEHGPRGWLDLPLAEAEAVAERLRTWIREGPGKGLMVSVDAHTDYHRINRAGGKHPLLAGTVDLDGCSLLGLGWDPGDHSMRHRGEREYGQVYPATLESHTGEAVLRWTIAPYASASLGNHS